MGRLAIMNHTGDFRLEYEAADTAVIEQARTKFDEARKNGYAAFSMGRTRGGVDGEIIKQFNPEAEIVMRPALAGG